MYDEIVILSNSDSCTNPQEWLFSEIGSKACGGPSGYIVYSKKTNSKAFLDKIKKYTDAQKAFNEKWGVGSDCSIAIMPTGIKCIDGKAKLSYE